MLPPSPQPPPKPATPAWVVILLFLIVLVIAAGVGVLARSLWILPPIDAVSISPPSSAPVSSGPAFDPTASAALVEMAYALSTSVAPTPTLLPTATPEPTYAIATAIPNVLCGTWVPLGQVCEWPLPAKPSPIPIPDCPADPRELCVWRGSLTPLPTPDHPWAPT